VILEKTKKNQVALRVHDKDQNWVCAKAKWCKRGDW